MSATRWNPIEISGRPSDLASARHLLTRGRPGLADMPHRVRLYAVKGGALMRLAFGKGGGVYPTDDPGTARTVEVAASRNGGRVIVHSLVGAVVPLDADGRRDEGEHGRLMGAFDLLLQTESLARVFPGSHDPEVHRRFIASRRFEPGGEIVACVVNDVPSWK